MADRIKETSSISFGPCKSFPLIDNPILLPSLQGKISRPKLNLPPKVEGSFWCPIPSSSTFYNIRLRTNEISGCEVFRTGTQFFFFFCILQQWMQWISTIFWKCYKLNSSIFKKCWKFIASKMLEIKSWHLTWGGPYQT